MRWYVVKNTTDEPFQLSFINGDCIYVKPGHLGYWYGSEDSEPKIQQAIDEGILECWEVKIEKSYRFNWKKEGF